MQTPQEKVRALPCHFRGNSAFTGTITRTLLERKMVVASTRNIIRAVNSVVPLLEISLGAETSRLTIDNSRFENNRAGGIDVGGGIATVHRSIASGNAGHGIAAVDNSVTVTVTSSVTAQNGSTGIFVVSGVRRPGPSCGRLEFFRVMPAPTSVSSLCSGRRSPETTHTRSGP